MPIGNPQATNWTSGGKTSWAKLISDGWPSTGTPGEWEDASGYEPVPLTSLPAFWSLTARMTTATGGRACARRPKGVTARI